MTIANSGWKRLLAAVLVASSGAGLLCAGSLPRARAEAPGFWKWAARPVMGWNSWDSFGTGITEAQAREQAEALASRLARYGWSTLVVDIQWYEPGATGFDYRPNAALTMDAWGRLLPAPNRFPSAAGGGGFKALASYAHGKGLKFGIHLMRGIPRQAVAQNTPILGTPYHARDIADVGSTCGWNSDMFGVDMSKPGAQQYYNSVFGQIANWGVDFVKVDDLSQPYHRAEIEGIRQAIERSGRPIVFSTSPGETPLEQGASVMRQANMWRISGDFWDSWPALQEQFERTRQWAPFIGEGHFPDADMLPLGRIRMGQPTRFTRPEQRTLMSLWCIARSPLVMGGDLTRLDDWTLSLLSNPEVLAVNQSSVDNRQLFSRNGQVGWVADVPGSRDKYLALFNTRDSSPLDEKKAAFSSPLVTRQTPGHSVPVSVDISGARKLYLVVQDGGDGFDADHAEWVQPRLIGAKGELKLTDLQWASARTGWGQPSTRSAASGGVMTVAGQPVSYGISAHSPSLIEYDLPAGYSRFEAQGALDDGGTSQARGATVHFLVFTTPPFGVPEQTVPVSLRELGLSGPCQVRDLWQRKNLGHVAREFAPAIEWHGAGLYRVSS